jgi:hypothetical protein
MSNRRLTLFVVALALVVAGLVVAAWNLTDTRENVPPIEITTS